MIASAPVEPAFASVPEHVRTLGDEVADLAALTGFAPDPEQRLVLDAMFALGRDGHSAAFEVAVICARQNLKTGLLKQAALGKVFLLERDLFVWSAHEFRTSQEAFRDLSNLIESTPALDRQVLRISRGNGDEAIELRKGQRIIFKARTKAGGRGLTGDDVALDEAFALTAAHMGALLPTLSARPDPQVLYASSAGLPESDVLRTLRDRGRRGNDPRLAYFEWCDDLGGSCANPDCPHTVTMTGCRLDDRRRWHRANPALGRRITENHIASERRALPPSEFARERLGWWDEAGDAGSMFSIERWIELESQEAVMDRPAAFAVEVAPDRATGVIVAAGPAGDRLAVEVVERRHGVSWLTERCRTLASRYGRPPFVVDGGGPAADLIPALKAAGADVVAGTTRDLAAASAALVDAITDGSLAHGPQPELDAAIAGARKRYLGDGMFSIGRRASAVDVTPLVAAALAVWCVQTHDPTPPVYVHDLNDYIAEILAERERARVEESGRS